MTAYGSEDTAVEALRAGATNYLRKPFKTQEFLSVVRKCIEPRTPHLPCHSPVSSTSGPTCMHKVPVFVSFGGVKGP